MAPKFFITMELYKRIIKENDYGMVIHLYFLCKIVPLQPRVKVFRIIPEFRILRLTLTFHRKSGSKMLNWRDYNRFSDSYSVFLKAIDHLNLKL